MAGWSWKRRATGHRAQGRRGCAERALTTLNALQCTQGKAGIHARLRVGRNARLCARAEVVALTLPVRLCATRGSRAAPILLEELVDPLLQLRPPCCRSVEGNLPVDVGDISRTIPDTQTRLSSGQLVVLPEAEPLGPALINDKIPFSLGSWRLGSEGRIDRVNAQPIQEVDPMSRTTDCGT